jgi:PAS domain S-box-containing protein
MIFFNRAEQVSGAAIKWLMSFFIVNLLFIGTIFRIYINKRLMDQGPWAQDFLVELDQTLVLSFWVLVFVALGFALFFVRTFFSPLGSLIAKSKSILKGDLNIKRSDLIKESRGEWYQLDLSLNKIWKDLKRKKADVVRERGELEAVITAASDAILAVDSDMNIRYYNAPMALLFDQKEEGNWGKKLTEVIRTQKIIEAFQKAVREQKSQRVEAQQEMSMDSAMHYFKVAITPFLDEKKSKPRGAVAIFHDITDHKKVEKVRMDFVANASHELKTPLTSIQGYLDFIKSQCQTRGDLQESFKVVENNMDRLNSIIQDLLQLSKVESAETVQMEAMDTMMVTESVVHDLQGRVREKQQDLIFHYNIKTVYANREMLEHVIMNLIENAVKYSPEKAQVKITWGETDQSFYFSVKDNGPGIESYHQGRLFERFYRVRDESTHNTKGTGLGLSIVRNCMQKMQGTVDVKSAPGLGSEFVCYFPKS